MAVVNPILTTCRRALWEALDNWAGLAGVFKRTYRYDKIPSPAEPPALGDLPALAIYPAPSQTTWNTNQVHELAYSLQFRLYTHSRQVSKGEELWQEIVRALYQSAPVGGQPYVFDATDSRKLDVGPFAVADVATTPEAGGPEMTVWTWTVTVFPRWNPNA